jgi:polysaccharide export outer membrane protein
MFDFPDIGGAGLHLTVSGDGTIHVPYAGTIQVEGMYADQIEHAIERALQDKDIVKSPAVSVEILTGVNMFVNVIGQVKNPQSIPIYAPVPMSFVMSKVGGPNGIAAKFFTVIHHTEQAPTTVQYDPEAPSPAAMTMLVYPGDIVHVSSAGVFFMIGEVNHPGIFPLGGALSVGQATVLSGMGVVHDMTLLQAITQAGGVTSIAARSKTRLLRTVNGKREEIMIDIVKLEKGEIADPIMHADDILYVPSSYIRSQTNHLFGTAVTALYASQQLRTF